MQKKKNNKFRTDSKPVYSLPELTTNILRPYKYFPLWTSVMQPYINSPYDAATSASVDGDFKELKCHIICFERKTNDPDRLIVNHLNSIDK